MATLANNIYANRKEREGPVEKRTEERSGDEQQEEAGQRPARRQRGGGETRQDGGQRLGGVHGQAERTAAPQAHHHRENSEEVQAGRRRQGHAGKADRRQVAVAEAEEDRDKRQDASAFEGLKAVVC